MRIRIVVLGLLLASAPLLSAAAQMPPVLDRLQRADGAKLVPDRFLRRWDPVTVLFDSDTGPAAGGPEDAPDRLVTLTPPKPGAWTWLGPRTLQFRPTEPWEPLRRQLVRLGSTDITLVPLLSPPTATGPSDAANGTSDLDTLSLTFPQPVDEAVLARLLTIELTEQSGPAKTQALPPSEYEVRALERSARSDPQTYVVALRRPVPDGKVATLRLRLSDEPGLDDPIFEIAFRSAVPFQLSDTSCGDSYSRTLVDGVTVCEPSAEGAAKARQVVLQFTAMPQALTVVQARDLLRITPPVDGLKVDTAGDSELHVTAGFMAGKNYEIAIAAGTLHDVRGRLLSNAVAKSVRFSPATPRLAWDAPRGIVERLGPQMVPLDGRGYERAEVRIVPIDPLSRDFWPFPSGGLATNDGRAPPLPGTEPERYADAGPIDGDAMAARVGALGSPALSELLPLPIKRGGLDSKFGLDLKPSFARIAGPDAPGTYLVGLRAVDGVLRHWARIQVTDLVLTTVEDVDRVHFTVTSLSSAQPVPGAEIRLQGQRDDDFVTLAQGTTGADGALTLVAPLAKGRDGETASLRRIVVTKADDTLVLEPGRGPQQYADGTWNKPNSPWLSWMAAPVADRRPKPQVLCHVFTERPIYRPEEPVLIAGMIRRYDAGALSYARGTGQVLVTGPGEQEWRLPVTLDDIGGFHVRFDAKTEATGDYAIQYQPESGATKGQGCGSITVKKEAYRLPTFEALLTSPLRVPLDAPFSVNLLARFFAGGMLSERPVTWRVTQFPYVWTPPNREGFLFSSDSRFSGDSTFRTTPVLNREVKTDAGGSAQLTLDPTQEPTAQPRTYLVEATVTGDDDQQVRSTQRITALPPFVLGVKQSRYLPGLGPLTPEIVALDGEGNAVSGLDMTVRLVHRQWNSLLQASDFAQGAAKYQTEVIDETAAERQVTSGAEPVSVPLGVSEAGVYVVEVSARDKVGRTQTVKVDLFVAGDTPVTWQAPPSQTVTVSTDKDRYDPGETATMLIQSPFQAGRALAVVEEPENRFRYDWVEIANGFGRFAVPIRKAQVPKLTVHFLLMRGRLPGPVNPATPFDQGKPVTLAATAAITVNPSENRVNVSFEAPAQARPAQEFDLVLHLSDAAGRPLAGEATVWMVDQAVLALAKEQPLDPLAAFIVNRPARMVARDTRNMAFGVIPLAEAPGGDEAGDFGMENISVRKNFTPVPLYEPRVKVGPDGTARIHVKLPDTLTVFMLRAKAVSGPDRFGFGSGQMKVRQPIVAQAALPRFVRPGDRFTAGLIGRIVVGPGGVGRAAISLDNLQLQGAAEQPVTWDGQRPARTDYTLDVPEPASDATTARVRFLLQRTADRASDALQVDLPIRPDRPAVHRQDFLLAGSGPLSIPPPAEAVRPPSYVRTLTLASDPVVTRLITAAGFLTRPMVGGVEQRMALARGELALLPFTPVLDAAGLRDRMAADVAAAIATIRMATDDDGLVGFFPKTPGMVWLTADVYRVLVSAARAGLPVDKAMSERMAKVLTAALRSDYPHLMSGAELFDRVSALLALADAGQISTEYATELARRVPELRTASAADVALVLSRLPETDRRLLPQVLDAVWGRVNLLSRDGKPTYAGLVDSPATPRILPSEARSLAQVTQAVATATPDDPRLAVLRTALLTLAGNDGWGTTNANASALEALAASWQAPARSATVTISLPDRRIPGTLDRAHPLVQARTTQPGATQVQAPAGTAVLTATDYVPAQPGAQAQAEQHGFALTRELLKVNPTGPMTRLAPDADGIIRLTIGDVVEEVAELVSDADRPQVALVLPLAAGMEPLNPALATAPAEAQPSAGPSLAPSWASYADDAVTAVWLQLPRGTYGLRTRMRATIAGSFTQPPAVAAMLYAPGTNGSTGGARIVITR